VKIGQQALAEPSTHKATSLAFSGY